MLTTELTRRLGLTYPVVSAPMGRGAGARLLGAMSRAGALGFLGVMHIPEKFLAKELSTIRSATDGKYGVNLTLIVDQQRRLEIALENGVDIFSVWQGNPVPYISKIKKRGGQVFWTVGSPQEAARAKELGVDFIVCQGRDAGGHLIGAAPTMTLLPAVIDAANGIPVVAAGGIGDGRGLAAALALGAVGAWMGTRFVASAELESHSDYKNLIVKATLDDVVETTVFDGGWGGSPHRVIRNSTVAKWEAAGSPSRGQRPDEDDVIGAFEDGTPLYRYNIASPWEGMSGSWEPNALYAGTSTQLIKEVKPVSEILEDLALGAEEALAKAVKLVDNADDSCHLL